MFTFQNRPTVNSSIIIPWIVLICFRHSENIYFQYRVANGSKNVVSLISNIGQNIKKIYFLKLIEKLLYVNEYSILEVYIHCLVENH